MSEKKSRKLTIHVGEKRSLEVGGLRFVVCRRELDDTGGATFEVWGDVDGEDTQVLRFDCFRGAPHYHMPPSAPGQIELDPEEVGDGLDWAIECARSRMPEMVEKAGFGELARALDSDALAGAAGKLARLAAEAPEPSESYEVDLDQIGQ